MEFNFYAYYPFFKILYDFNNKSKLNYKGTPILYLNSFPNLSLTNSHKAIQYYFIKYKFDSNPLRTTFYSPSSIFIIDYLSYYG